jgi:hypothetical protein
LKASILQILAEKIRREGSSLEFEFTAMKPGHFSSCPCVFME